MSRFQTDPTTGKTLARNASGATTVEIDSSLGLVGTNGYAANDLPTGWSGGVRTLDVYAGGTLAVGPTTSSATTASGRTFTGAAGLNRNGDMWANNDLVVRGNIYLNNRPTPLNTLLPQYSSRGVDVVVNGSGIGKPNCGTTGGVAKVVVTPAIMTSPISAGGGSFWNANGFIARANDYGSWWGIELSGWPYSVGQNYALAHKYCFFGAGT